MSEIRSGMGEALIASGAHLKNRYRLDRPLGRGGMASVWLATDELLERPVAIKVLSDTLASDPEFLARFRREARIAAGLSHPNLVGIFDYADRSERPYLVMEYVPGGTLAERIAGSRRVECERLARELLGALGHIHAAGIVHRDVKPANVLYAEDETTRLIDFGIALPADATALTRTGNLLGTARYMAPEVMAGRPATGRSDLYSCGVVLRDCAAEDRAGLASLISRLTEREPELRPPSAQAAAALLDAPASRPGTRTERLDQPTAEWRPPPRPPARPVRTRPSRAAPIALVAAIAAGAVLAFALLNGTGGGGDPKGGKASADRAARGDDAGGGAAPASTATAEVPEPSGTDPATGGALNEQGYALIQEGRPDEAVPILEQAVEAFPPGSEDLNYAYALFNLGNALRLSGRPEDAIPVLEQRLTIPNQTEVVRRELDAARAEAAS